MSVNIGKAIGYMDLDISGFDKGFQDANALLRRFGDKTLSLSSRVESLGKVMSDVGAEITKGITVPVLGAGAVMVKTATDADTAARKVATIADGTIMDLAAIKKSAREMSNDMGVAATDVSEGLYAMISATGDTAAAVDNMRVAGKAAIGGFADQATAVDGLTTVMNAYGMKGAAAMEAVSDQMLTAQNYGKTTFGELASSIGNVIPLAATLHVGTGELFGAMATLTKQGLGTSEAVTGLKATFSGVLKPTAEASKLAKSLGLDFSAAALESKGFAGFMDDVKAKTGGSTEAMSQLFGSVEALNTMLALTSDTGRSDMAGAMQAMANSAGATQAAYDTMTGGLEGSFKRVKEQATNLAASFGEIIMPVVEEALGWVSDIVAGLQSMDPAMQTTIVRFAGIAAAVGPVLLIGGKLVTLFSTIGALFTGPAGWVTLGLVALPVLGTALAGLMDGAESTDAKISKIFDNVDQNRVNDISAKIRASVSVEVGTGETDLGTAIDNAYQPIIDALKTGGVVTQEDADAVQANVDNLITAAVAGVDITANQKLKELKAQLDAGVIDTATYKAQCDQVIADANSTKAALQDVRKQSDATVSDLVGDASATADSAAEALGKISGAADSAVASINGMGALITVGSIYDVISQKLTDGLPDSESQTDTLTDTVDTWLAGEKTKLEKAINAQIAALDINDADYTAKTASIKTQGAEMLAELETVAGETRQWLIDNSGAATNEVKKHLDELDRIEQRAMEVTAKIEQTREAEKSVQEKNVARVKGGYVRDTDTISDALGVVYTDKQNQTAALEEERKAAVAELQSSNLTGDAYAAKEQEIDAYYAAMNKRIIAEYRKNLSELQAGIAKAYPEDASLTQTYVDNLHLADQTQEIIDAIDKGTFDVDKDAVDAAILRKMFGSDDDQQNKSDWKDLYNYYGANDAAMVLMDVYTELMHEAEKTLDEGIKPGVLAEMLNSEINEGLFDGLDIDMTDGQNKLRALVGDLGDGMDPVEIDVPTKPVLETGDESADETDIKDDMKGAGENGAIALADGAAGKTDYVTNKFKRLAQAAVRAAKEGLEIASPSKAMQRIGKNAGTTLADSLSEQTPNVRQSMLRMVDLSGMRSGIDRTLLDNTRGLVTAKNTYTTHGPTINVTLPNASIRSDDDARKMARMLGDYAARVSAGRGE